MKLENDMTLEFPSKSANESFARACISAFAAQLDPTLEEINDIKTAVSEAVTNCIVHGYAGTTGNIDIFVGIRKNVIYIKIRDYGVGIADIEKAKQPFFTTRSREERSGMGFTLMESFMDTMNVYNNLDGGVTVELSKEIRQ